MLFALNPNLCYVVDQIDSKPVPKFIVEGRREFCKGRCGMNPVRIRGHGLAPSVDNHAAGTLRRPRIDGYLAGAG